MRIINNRTRFDPTNKIFKSRKIANIHKLNILSAAVLMYQIRNKTASLTFSGSFEKICHEYQKNFSQLNYKIPKTVLSKSKFRFLFTAPCSWNNFLQNSGKETRSLPLFKSKLKLKLLSLSKKITYSRKIFMWCICIFL